MFGRTTKIVAGILQKDREELGKIADCLQGIGKEVARENNEKVDESAIAESLYTFANKIDKFLGRVSAIEFR